MGVLANRNADFMLDTFDRLTISALLVDSELKIVSSNGTAEQIFLCPAEDFRGRSLSEFIVFGRHQGNNGGKTEWCENEEPLVFDSVCKKKDGEKFAARISFHPLQSEHIKIVAVQDLSAEMALRRRASQRTKELSVFNTFASILRSHKETDAIMQETLEMLLSSMKADSGWIYLYHEETTELHLKFQKRVDEALTEAVEQLRPGECFVGKVFSSGRPLLVKKASEDPRVTHRQAGIESMAGVPIFSKGVLVGVLGIASRQSSYFSAMDIQLLSTIGSQLGVATENLKLIDQLRHKMKHIELINELSGIINSNLSIGTIFRIIVSEIGKLITYSRASLLLYNEKEDTMLILALDTGMKTLMKKGMKSPIDGTTAGWVIRNNRPWINYDLRKLNFPLDGKLLDEGIRSTISIPLFHDKILGVFNMDSTEPSRYSEKDLEVLLPAAKHISIALENALLFEEISREKKEWEKTFDAITDLMWIEDGGQRIIRANNALLLKAGFSSTEISEKLCCDVLDRIGIKTSACLCSDTIANKKPSFLELKTEKAGIFHSWSYPLIDEEGELYAIVHYLKDVTDRKRLEQQLIRSDSLASLGTLVAGIAHEINNPLGIIAGYSEALIDRGKDVKLRNIPEFCDFPEYLETIHNEIFRCKSILRNLLDFARPSYGTLRDIDINELIKEVILLVNHKAKRLNHKIELVLKRELPKICVDPGSLRQLFMNIIINSIYFTPERGRITIKTELDPLGQSGEAGTELIKISVSDTGSGIPEDMRDKIFNPFFTTKPVGEGTGLGLAICHKIAEEHGGTIDVESSARGTTFILRFPCKRE